MKYDSSECNASDFIFKRQILSFQVSGWEEGRKSELGSDKRDQKVLIRLLKDIARVFFKTLLLLLKNEPWRVLSIYTRTFFLKSHQTFNFLKDDDDAVKNCLIDKGTKVTSAWKWCHQREREREEINWVKANILSWQNSSNYFIMRLSIVFVLLISII